MKTKGKKNSTVHSIGKVNFLPQMPLLSSAPILLRESATGINEMGSTHLAFPDVYYSSRLQALWKEFPEEINQLLKRSKALNVQFDFIDAYADRINNYRKELVREWLQKRKREMILVPTFIECDDSDDIREGKTEGVFYERLQEDLPFRILRKRKIQIGEYYYYPDIIIIAEGLFIDIEIDEPYSEGEDQPIHYVENIADELVSVDAFRNNTLTSLGWEVIRFAEEQIVCFPDECVKFIKRIIDSLLTDGSRRPATPFIHRVKKWTKAKAKFYARIKYRDKYIV